MTVSLGRFRVLLRVALLLVFLVIFTGAMVPITGSGYQQALGVDGNEAQFAALQTWIDFGNRILGILAGMAMLTVLGFSLVGLRHRARNIALSLFACILLGLQGWSGVWVDEAFLAAHAVNLHLIVALLIAALLLLFDHLLGLEPGLAREDRSELRLNQIQIWLLSIIVLLTVIQIFLGVQVRAESQAAIWNQAPTVSWLDNDVGLWLHRTGACGLALLILIFAITAVSRRRAYPKTAALAGGLVLLVIMQALSGLLLEFAGMPPVAKPLHLVGATGLFSIEILILARALTPLPHH